jgi:hypothetical protein
MQAFTPFPKNISRNALTRLRDDLTRRQSVLQTIVRRFEAQYNVSLESFEARLAQGKGRNTPIGRIPSSGATP